MISKSQTASDISAIGTCYKYNVWW